MWIETIGYLAGLIWVSQAFPQIYKVYQSKKAWDLSYLTIYMVIFATILWWIYGYSLQSWPILYPNLLLWISYIFLLIIKIKYDKKKRT